jgi:hypothetical protein
VATLGLFDPELVPSAWFSPELEPLAWFDRTFIGATSAVSVDDVSVVVLASAGVETASFAMLYDASVPVSAFVGVETVTSTFYDEGVVVEVQVGVESSTFTLFDDVSVPVNAVPGIETLAANFDDASVPVNAVAGIESATFTTFDDVSVPVNAFVGVEAVTSTFLDESAVVEAAVGVETLSSSPTPPGPTPSARAVVGGGTPLEDYLIDGVPVREWRQVLDGERLLEEIVELPVREETDEEREAREKGEPRFSGLLSDIISGPVPEKDEPRVVTLKTAALFALGAFALGAIVMAVLKSGDDDDDDDDDSDDIDENELREALENELDEEELDEDPLADVLDQELDEELGESMLESGEDEDGDEDEDEERPRSAIEILRELRDERRRAEDGVGWQFFARQGRVVRDAPRAVDRLIEKHSVPLGEPTSEEIADAAQFVFSGGVEEPLLSPSELASRFGT